MPSKDKKNKDAKKLKVKFVSSKKEKIPVKKGVIKEHFILGFIKSLVDQDFKGADKNLQQQVDNNIQERIKNIIQKKNK